MIGIFKAVFFDRDGTLSRINPEKEIERDAAIGRILGKPHFRLTDESKTRVFKRVMDLPGFRPVSNLDREHAFWRRWFQTILEDNGAVRDAEALAADLYERFAFSRIMQLFPETLTVLQTLKSQGYRMGVISDTFPSLEQAIVRLGIASYFESLTASSLVGAGKPDPRIFRAATQSLGVTPQESVFVDDCREEADGARCQGFTSFHLDRTRAEPDFEAWTIANLSHLLDYLQRP